MVRSSTLFVLALGLLGIACGGSGSAPAPSSPQPPVIQAFAATPANPGAGQPVAFSWQVDAATGLTLEGPGGSLGPVQGSALSYIPARSGSYTLHASNAAGSASAQVQITLRAPDPAQALFAWSVPWNDASASVTDLSGLLPAPAGASGFVRAQAGHLAVDTGRIRFWGTNTTFQANFPSHDEAEAVAAHLAKSGINLVRLHHMDTQASPNGIWTTAAPDRTIDPTQLDRLDYFVSCLKAHGVYVDLNLLVGRPLARGTELPADIDLVDTWKTRHVLGFFDPQILQLEKDYAKALLAHVNPYTGVAYAQEKGVALVEIINENGLALAFKNNQLDALPATYGNELTTLWNSWLKQRYGNQAGLVSAWGAKVISPPGAELLKNADFASGLTAWTLEQHETAQASAAVVTDDVPAGQARAVKLQLLQPGSLSWHIQFNQAALALDAATPYTATFWAKSDRAQSMLIDLGMAHDPWAILGFQQTLALTTSWQAFSFNIAPSASDTNARLNFGGMGLDAGSIWLSGISLKPGGYLGLVAGEDLDAGSIHTFLNTGEGPRTLAGWKDWFHFLSDTEATYWTTMRQYLKTTLQVQPPVIGTISGYTTPNQMAAFDVEDTHGYWQHPVFPGTPWDSHNWYVVNRPMVAHPDQATLPDLALQRVLGKPHVVTEYDHPAPNTFQVEGLWTLAAYAGLQDFDAVLQFDYQGDRNWSKTTLDGYFDLAHNPVQMTSMTAAGLAFLRGDISPAQGQVVASLSQEQEWSALAARADWRLPDARQGGVNPLEALVHRTALATEGMSVPASSLLPGSTPVAGPTWSSDTSELNWNTSDAARSYLDISTSRSHLVLGYLDGRSFQSADLQLLACPTLQQGFCALSLTVLEGGGFATASRVLLSALGTQQNPGAAWAAYPAAPLSFPPPPEAQLTFLNNQWGQGPTQVEGITAELSLPLPAGQLHVFALDPTGAHQSELPVYGDATSARVVISPVYRTLWYEVQIQR